jgi:hypothetical protein
VAALPVVINRGALFIRSQTSAQRKKYRGQFLLYHWSGTQPLIRTKIIKFRLSFFHGIMATMPYDSVTRLSYRGRILPGGGEVVYVSLEGAGHKERLFLAFYDPVHPLFTVTSGVMASVSLNDEPMSWNMILSRSPLGQSEIEHLLGKKQLLRARKIGFNETGSPSST